MARKQPKQRSSKELSSPPETPVPSSGPVAADPHKQAIEAILKSDPEEQLKQSRSWILNVVAANVLAQQNFWCVKDTAGEIAQRFVSAIFESIQPRDAVEQMLALQMAWTHARLGKLSESASHQTLITSVHVVHDACDRAAGTFRRQMLALAEYRRPQRSDSFVPIKQANMANQQVGAKCWNPKRRIKKTAKRTRIANSAETTGCRRAALKVYRCRL